MPIARAAALLSVLLLSGCLSSSDGPTQTATSTSSSQATDAKGLFWSSCHGAGTAFSWPNGEGPQGRNPPGWSNETEDIDNQWFLTMFTCERVGAGPYERGPVSMALEFHNQFTAPEKCKEGADYNQASVLQWLYVDDAELAAYLRETFGMPTVNATFGERVSTTGPTQAHRWSLTVDGQESYFETHTLSPLPARMPWLERLFWAHGDNLLVMDWAQDRQGDNIYGTTAVGRMEPPTLYGTWRAGEFYSVASVIRELGLEATIQRFGDLQCARPA